MSKNNVVVVTAEICRQGFMFDGIIGPPAPTEQQLLEQFYEACANGYTGTYEEWKAARDYTPTGMTVEEINDYPDYPVDWTFQPPPERIILVTAHIIPEDNPNVSDGDLVKDILIVRGEDPILALYCGLKGVIQWEHYIKYDANDIKYSVTLPCDGNETDHTACLCGFKRATLVRQFHGPIFFEPTSGDGGPIPRSGYDYSGDSISNFAAASKVIDIINEKHRQKSTLVSPSGGRAADPISEEQALVDISFAKAKNMAQVLHHSSVIDSQGRRAFGLLDKPPWRFCEEYAGTVPNISNQDELAQALYDAIFRQALSGLSMLSNKYCGLSAYAGRNTDGEYVYFWSFLMGNKWSDIDSPALFSCPSPHAGHSRAFLPGERLDLHWTIDFKERNGLIREKIIPVAATFFFTHSLIGGYIEEVVGEYNSIDLKYMVRIFDNDELVSVQPTDFVEYEVGDWVFMLRDTPSGKAGQEEKTNRVGTVDGCVSMRSDEDLPAPEDPESAPSIKALNSELVKHYLQVDQNGIYVDPLCPSATYLFRFYDEYSFGIYSSGQILAWNESAKDLEPIATGSIYEDVPVQGYFVVRKETWNRIRPRPTTWGAEKDLVVMKIGRDRTKDANYRIFPFGLIDAVGDKA